MKKITNIAVYIISFILLLACPNDPDVVAGSDNADLATLEVNPGTLHPDFDPDITEYTVLVENTVTGITVNAEAAEPGVAEVANDGDFPLSVGENSAVISVTAEDGTVKDYSLTIYRTVPGTFQTTWQTDNPGTSDDNQISLPLVEEGIYDFTIDWGDGSSDIITGWDDPDRTHTYASAGAYDVEISGILEGFSFGMYPRVWDAGASVYYCDDSQKLTGLSSWGPLRFGNTGGYFFQCGNLAITATDTPDLSGIYKLRYIFGYCESLADVPGIGDWDVSAVSDMEYAFCCATAFNSDISGWDVSGVTNMRGMFYCTEAFSGDIGGWDVSSVTVMEYLFLGAELFNADISGWDVSNVTNMNCMFYNAYIFNRDIGNWDVSSVTLMKGMFCGALDFNQDIGGWDVSNVTDMGADIYDHPDYDYGWSYGGMFEYAASFNQDLSEWDVSAVTNMNMMFRDAESFHLDLGDWDVSGVRTMKFMFDGADAFDQNLGVWNIASVCSMENMFDRSGLTTTNYDAILTGWSALPVLQYGIMLGAEVEYSSAAAAARQILTDDYGWIIDDYGEL
ncbi:MAG: BspA family leucine-rich repeat surface protein [Spirochaetales bacterium]|nr:BspA family leucine-rich repeat surface protein [Spirochaetales bacterium]